MNQDHKNCESGHIECSADVTLLLEEKARQHKKHRKYRMAAPIGIVLILLSLVGVVALGISGVNWVISLNDDSAQKAKIEQDIATVVNLDPVPFDSIDKADVNMKLNASVWLTLKSSTKKEFATNEEGSLMLPQTDVEVSYKKLFGKSAAITHQTIKNIGEGTEYVFDESNKSYLIPPTGLIDSFIPKVESIKKSGKQYYVRVGYVPTDTAWGIDTDGSKVSPQPYKYMTYVLEKDDTYYITAIKEDAETS